VGFITPRSGVQVSSPLPTFDVNGGSRITESAAAVALLETVLRPAFSYAAAFDEAAAVAWAMPAK
jgi:hypothetical protein